MTFEEQWFATLNALALAGGVWPNTAKDSALVPRIVFSRISTVPENDLIGDAPGIAIMRMQVDCYESNYFAAHTLANNVKAAMVAAAVAKTISNTLASEADLYEAEVKQHRVTLDFTVLA